MNLGIEQNRSLVYEGLSIPELPVVPRPVITLAKLIQTETDWSNLPHSIDAIPLPWVFREDSFDSVSRTRRGRLYVPEDVAQPSDRQVFPHSLEGPNPRDVNGWGRVQRSLRTYRPCTELLAEPNRGQGVTLALGTSRAASAWRIVHAEVLVSGDVMVTLKALSAFGILPDVDIGKVPTDQQVQVKQSIDRVLDSAFRETPISTIDHCRNAAAVIVSRWLVQQGAPGATTLSKDLGGLAEDVGDSRYRKTCVQWLCQLIARLHARGKTNEQSTKGLRNPVEEDAELALQAVGFILRELGWARS